MVIKAEEKSKNMQKESRRQEPAIVICARDAAKK